MSTLTELRRRATDIFAFDSDWARTDPNGLLRRSDWVVGVLMAVVGVTMLELYRSIGTLKESVALPLWVEWLIVISGSMLLVARRRWPLITMLLAAAHMFGAGIWTPVIMGQLALQVSYFVAMFAGVAWARNRRDVLVTAVVISVFMGAWLAWQFAFSGLVDYGIDEDDRSGVFGPATATVLLTAIVNLFYFGGAMLGGQVAWRSARQRSRLAEQADTISRQAEELQSRAVVDERLRIARELHDVVAHHVSVIGIQAAAGRRMLGRDDAAVETAIAQVEDSSREAVGQMRTLLGTLRDPSAGRDDDGARRPQPTLSALPTLAAEVSGSGLRVEHDLVERPTGAAAGIPDSVGHSVYRIVQEALTNVRRHSTADSAKIVLRVDRTAPTSYVEVEVTDNGRPRIGTSGSGLGLLGVRERAAARHGEVEIGPRSVGGYRVRVRLPLETP